MRRSPVVPTETEAMGAGISSEPPGVVSSHRRPGRGSSAWTIAGGGALSWRPVIKRAKRDAGFLNINGNSWKALPWVMSWR